MQFGHLCVVLFCGVFFSLFNISFHLVVKIGEMSMLSKLPLLKWAHLKKKKKKVVDGGKQCIGIQTAGESQGDAFGQCWYMFLNGK